MRKTTIAALTAALMAGSAGLALAQPGPGGGPGMGGPGSHRPHYGPRGGNGFAMGEAFARADTNNDGKVTREEAMAWVQLRFTEVDADKDGAITVEEWRAYHDARRPQNRRPRGERMREGMQQRGLAMFRFIDVNLDGRVTMDELRPMAEAAFRALDANSDGAVARDELRHRRPDGQRGPRGQRGPGQPPAPSDAPQPPATPR